MEHLAQITPSMSRHFAPHQIKRLNAVGAFINLRDARIAYKLLHAMFADVAMPAQNLHTKVGHIKSHIS